MEGIIDRGQLSTTPGYMSHSDNYKQCKGHVRHFKGKAYIFFYTSIFVINIDPACVVGTGANVPLGGVLIF